MKVDQTKINYLTMIFGTDYGLPMIAIGIAFTLFSLMNIIVGPLLKPFNTAQSYYIKDVIFIFTLIAFLIVLPASTLFLQKYYTQKFGTLVRKETVSTITGKLLFFLSILLSFFLGTWIDVNYLPPISATLSIIAAVLVLNWFFVTRPAGNIDLVLGVLIGVLGSVPGVGIIPREGFYLAEGLKTSDYFINLTMLIWGMVYVFKGIYDHLFMTQMLKPISMEENNELV